jgi:hypothetical protein
MRKDQQETSDLKNSAGYFCAVKLVEADSRNVGYGLSFFSTPSARNVFRSMPTSVGALCRPVALSSGLQLYRPLRVRAHGAHYGVWWVWSETPRVDQQQTPWPLVRKRTIQTERPPLVGEIWCQLLWIEGCRVVSAADPPRPWSRYFFFQVPPHLSSQGLSGPRSRPTATQNMW